MKQKSKKTSYENSGVNFLESTHSTRFNKGFMQ